MNADKDVVIVAARGAYPHYLKYAMYFCQLDRPFRDVARMGFYTGNEIKREVPRILARQDRVVFDRRAAQALQASGVPSSAQIGLIVERLLEDGVLPEGAVEQVFLLSPAGDERTLVLPAPIRNTMTGPLGRRTAWTQWQRYTSSAALAAGPATTDELQRLGG